MFVDFSMRRPRRSPAWCRSATAIRPRPRRNLFQDSGLTTSAARPPLSEERSRSKLLWWIRLSMSAVPHVF